MRCYICDWSPTAGDSLYHETIEIDSFTKVREELHLPEVSRPLGYHCGRPRLLFDKQDRPICSRCALHGQGEDPAFSESYQEPEVTDDPELEGIE